MSDSTSQPSSRTAKSGKFTSLSRTIKRSDIHLEVLSSQSRKSFEYFLCFHRTLGISLKDLEGFKADIAFIYTTLACSLTIWTLTFVTRNFIGSYVLRCAFWLVSRKDHCLERVLRKSFWIKKSINKIPSVCRINFEKYFIKAIENFFSCVCIAWYKHSRGWENPRQLCKTSTSSRVCITVSNSPNPSRVISGYANTENVFYCLNLTLLKLKETV